MTEDEWLTCTKPTPMLYYLLGANYPRVQDVESFPGCRGSARKLRLFACACYHHISHLLPNHLVQVAVEVAERFADGRATVEELEQADASLWVPLEALEPRWRASKGAERTALQPTHGALALGLQVVRLEAPKAAYYAASNAYLTFAVIANPDEASYSGKFSGSQSAEERVQTDILRCIFGNPFRPLTTHPYPGWLSSDVAALAHTIYDDRAFDRLPELGDALAAAGCENQDILGHCRMGGPHVRGCWVVDPVLGKE